MDRFWGKVNKEGPVSEIRPHLGQCWVWTGARSKAGYGQIRIKGVAIYTHRHSLTLAGVDIPSGYHVDHLCRNRACCNPKHLEPVTQSTNLRRAFDDLRLNCPRGHPYTPDNTLWIGKGTFRKCRTCSRAESLKRVRNYTPEQLERRRARCRVNAAAYHARMKDDPEFKQKARKRAKEWSLIHRIPKSRQSTAQA
jgi:hypothetical protein